MHIADLHIHSKYSRATSADCDAPHLDLWARYKGISLVGTGDFTHPKWREELKEMLMPAEEGLYRLKGDYALPCSVPGVKEPRFVVSGEISTIYKKNGKTRKVHHVILLPGLEEAEELSHRLEAIGNLHSDGRPILGLDSHDLLEIILESCPRAIYIPAHIWTPHFSLFGAFSGFDSVEECYGDLSPYVHAMETGLSSDPIMNRRVSMLDSYQLISNSDAHSPQKLGREANLLSCDLGFSQLKKAMETGDGLEGTVEFFPEEGKYHLDGHRACQCCLEPEETLRLEGKCPVCGKKITVGVLHRVEALADRRECGSLPKPFESIVPLPELVGETMGTSATSKKAQETYFQLLEKLGPEFSILREVPIEEAEKAGGFLLGEGLRRLRAGKVHCRGGYDGEYGVVQVFHPGEREELMGQLSLLPPVEKKEKKRAPAPMPKAAAAEQEDTPQEQLNEAQKRAVESEAAVTMVIAGPGTGKTKTLIARIAYLIEEKGIRPGEITAVTFTRQAALEMQERLEKRLGKKATRAVTVGTFHGICQKLLEPRPLITGVAARKLMEKLLSERGEKMKPAQALSLISREKNGLPALELPVGLKAAYQDRLQEMGMRDLDDLLLEALALPCEKLKQFHYLLVDEYQDINSVQRKLATHWSRGNHLFVIGDPDQSIYGFRGASAECFEELAHLYPHAERIRLEKNYRSSGAILESALSVINENPGEKRILSWEKSSDWPVRLMQLPDEEEEGRWIAEEIVRMAGGVDMHAAGSREGGTRAFSEIAVLCRTHRQLEKIERALNRESIPCTVSGRGAFLEDEKVQGLICFLEAMQEANGAALDTALKMLFRMPAALRALAAQSMACEDEWLDLMKREDAFSSVLPIWNEIMPQLAKGKPRKILEQLIQMTDCRGKAMEALLNTAVFYPDVPAFLSALRLGEEGDIQRLSGGKNGGAVRLMTLHAAKGLEFPAVFLAGMQEDMLPLRHAGEKTDVQEERRLFFVGITRAKEELIFTSGGAASSFLSEIGNHVKREESGRKKETRVQQMSLF